MDNGVYVIIKRAHAIITKEKGTLTNGDIAVLGGYLETLLEVYAESVKAEQVAPPEKKRRQANESWFTRIVHQILP